MNDIWNEICYRCQPYIDSNALEKDYEREFVNCLGKLGWLQWKGEIATQAIVIVGHERKRADIVVSLDRMEQFVVEMKRPGHQRTEGDQLQLFSYMRLLNHQVKFGLYIGNDIKLYYDDPTTNELPQIISTIEFTQDNPKGIELINLLNKSSYSEQELQNYCKKTLEEQKDNERVKKELKLLRSPEGLNSLLSDVKNIYLNKGFSEETANSIVENLIINIKKDIKTDCSLNKPIEYLKEPIEYLKESTNNKRSKDSKDHTKYLFNSIVYNKGKLVQAVLAEYVRKHLDTYANIEYKVEGGNVCYPSLIRPINAIKENEKCRYYTKDELLIKTSDNIRFAVCHEWHKENIKHFIAWAEKQGFEITPKKENLKQV